MADAASLVGVDHPREGCAVVTLQRPQALNALSLSLRRDLVRELGALANDGRTRVVVLTGAGRGFCAGLDLRELADAQDLGAIAASGTDGDPVHAVLTFPGPVIGAVNGPAITGGLELALACDILVASDRAVFADTHARVGVLPSWGMSQRLPRLIGRGRALEMSLTGNFIDAQQAERWGLVNRVVAHDALLPTALALAGDMLAAAPGMLAQCKRVVDDGLAATLHDGLAIEAQRAREWAATVDRHALKAQARAVRDGGRQRFV